MVVNVSPFKSVRVLARGIRKDLDNFKSALKLTDKQLKSGHGQLF